MNPSTIPCFLTVCETESFSKAGEKLFMSVPGVSKQINLLESDLGLQLFVRSNRGVRLTPAGEEVYSLIREHHSSINRQLQQIRERYSDGIKTLRIGVLGSDLHHIIPAFLRELQKCQPQIKVSLDSTSCETVIKDIDSGRIDLSFTYGLSKRRATDTVEYEDITQGTLLLNVPPFSPLYDREKLALPDLYHQELAIVKPGTSDFHDEIIKEIQDSGAPIRLAFSEENIVYIVTMEAVAKSDLFLGALFNFLRQPENHYIPFDFHGRKIPLGILFRKEDSSQVRAKLIPAVRQAFLSIEESWWSS